MIAGTGSFADHGELGSSRHNMRIFEPVRNPDATSRKVCSGSADHGAPGDESCIQRRSPSLGGSTNSNVECGGGGGQFRNHYTPPDHFGSFHSIATPATTGAGGYISSSATSSTALGAGASGFGTTETGGEGPISDHGNNRSLITPSTATTTASTWQPGSAAPEATPHDNAIPSELILMPPGNEATSVTSLTELHLPAVEPFHIQFDRRSDSSSLLDERQSDRSSAYSAHWWRRRGILTTRVMPPACTLDLERRSAASSDADRTYVSRTLTTQTQSSSSRSETDSRSRNSVSQDPSKTHTDDTQEDDYNDRESTSRGGGGAASRPTRRVVRGAPDVLDSVFGFGRQTSNPAEDHVVGVRIIDHSTPRQHVDGAPATSSSSQESERSPPAAARGARDPDPNAYHAQGAPIPANAPVRSRTTASDPAVANYIRRQGKTKRSTVDGNVPAAPDSLSNSKEKLPLVSEEGGAATSPRPLGDEEVDLTTSSYYEYAQQMGARPLDFDDASDHTYASHPSHISRATSATIPFHPLGSEGASRAGSAASKSSNSRTTSARAYPMQQGEGVALIQHDTHLHEPSSSSRSRTLQRAAQGQEQEANAPNQGPHRKDQVLSWNPAADSEEIDDDSLPALSHSARNIVPGQGHSSFFPTSLSPEAQKIALQRAIQQAVVTMETPVSFLLQVGGDNAAGGGRSYFAGIGAPEEEGGIMRGIKTSTKQQYWALNTALADSYLLNGEHLLDG